MDSVSNIILYFAVAIAMLAFSYMAVTTRKVLRAATYLLLVLICTGIFYFQLGYQFLGAVQLAVYAGGIMVLFVFAILLTAKPDDRGTSLSPARKFVGILAAGIGVVVLGFALFYTPFFNGLSLEQCLAGGADINMETIGTAMLSTEKFGYLLPFEAVSVLLLACIIGGVVVARKR